MVPNNIAEIIAAHTNIKTVEECGVSIEYKMLDGAGFIDALADGLEENDAKECRYCGKRAFTRAEFVRIATGS